jgi:hypothetical protein
VNSNLYAEIVHKTCYPELLEEAAARRLSASVRDEGPSVARRMRDALSFALIRAGERLQAGRPEVGRWSPQS